ncbi:MAG: hypothetical protein ACFFBP_15030 [Promethearchaeota archaeon]
MEVWKHNDYRNCIGRYTLIYGEVNTGKTFYTAKFVEFLIESGFNPKDISILDFAPRYEELKKLKIGGKLKDFYKNILLCNIINLKGEIIPPRLTARNKNELQKFARQNYIKTLEAIEKFNKNHTNVLIINDISIYLQFGNKKYLLNTIKKSQTFFGNSYFGKSIKSNYFSFFFNYKESRKVKYLIKKLDRTIKL